LKTHSVTVATSSAPSRRPTAGASAILLALAVFAGLWLLNAPYRQAYQPSHDDVTALADGLLLLPGARWTDWFTQGHTRFFIPYPEWSIAQTGFARPVYQGTIFLAHFILDRHWSSYLAINYLALAGVAAIGFAIARRVLGLRSGEALMAAALVLLAPAVSEFSLGVVGAGSESLATLLIGCAFLALVGERRILCFFLLLAAMFTKETALWAPVAATATLLCDRRGLRPLARKAWAGAMLLPIALWFAQRIAFYGGIAGTYATTDYASPRTFLALLGWKLLHLHPLFVSQQPFSAATGWAPIDQGIRIATALLLLVVLLAWALLVLRAVLGSARAVGSTPLPERRPFLLVSLWAAIGLAFYLLLAVGSPRYAAAAVMFAWPVVVASALREHRPMLCAALAALLVLSLARTAHYVAALNPPHADSETAHFFRAIGTMDAALRDVPANIRQVYVFTEDGMVPVTPAYLQAFLGIGSTLIRVADISWGCRDQAGAAIAHREADGETIVEVTLPDCARFFFFDSALTADAMSNGLLPRSRALTYELPEALPAADAGGTRPMLALGRRIILHVRANGPARFIVEHGAPDGGLAWFDVP
jgi:hypothetical protein